LHPVSCIRLISHWGPDFSVTINASITVRALSSTQFYFTVIVVVQYSNSQYCYLPFRSLLVSRYVQWHCYWCVPY